MARIQGTAKLSSTLEPRMGAPLDARERVFLKADLTAEGSFPYPWVGMEVYCAEDGKKYRLIDTPATNIDNWLELSNGGGSSIDSEAREVAAGAMALAQQAIEQSGGTIDTEMSDSSTNAVQNKVIKSYVDTQVTEAIAQVLNTGF